MALIYFKDISKAYNSNLVLDDINFSVEAGEFVSLVGKSGVGKTTLLKLIIADEQPSSGHVIFDDQDLSKLKGSQLSLIRRRVGTVFQDFRLFNDRTVFENVAFPLEVLNQPDEIIQDHVTEVLKLVGLDALKEQLPVCLSAGEKQRAAIARALIHGPDVIIADEPTGNLDPINTWDIMKLLLRINELGTAIILTTHNKDVVNKIGKRVISLENGKIIRDELNGQYII
ncbi:MAG TPA: ATP-binding cassette domain-containing protein [Candidatus Paceibacterota bacterium]|nr:ATP-binding cassette domain-containing protein [Candidatus Paceibacterota bacterium]